MIRLFLLVFILASAALADNLPVKATRASATLESQDNISYSTRNLIDGSASSVWAAPFQMQSIFVELKVDAYEINALHILNGYRKSQQAYENNSRAKTIKIYVNNKQNLVKTVTLKDLPWEYCFGEFDAEGCKNFLQTTNYSGVVEQYQATACNDICHPLDYSEEVYFSPALRNVKILIIQIESIYPGKKWNDLVISELSLEGYAQSPVKSGYVPEWGSVVDPRDGQEYKTFKVGKKNWLAQNLAYADEGSDCFEKVKGSRCSEKGRLYQESSVDDGLCPIGWRLPTKDEFLEFNKFIQSHTSDSVHSFSDLFVTAKSSNSFGMNFYNLDGLCSCFDAGCDGDPFGELTTSLYDKYHSADQESPNETAFWVKPFKVEGSEEDIPFMRFNAFNGAYVPAGEQFGCFRNGGSEHRKEFFVRCVEE